MKLNIYIDEVGVKKFASLTGISEGQIYKYQRLESIPEPETARRIKTVTNGIVDYADMYDPFFDSHAVPEKQLKMKV